MLKKQKGSSLALTLIFATTIGIVLAGVGYTLKVNLLRNKGINEALQSDLLRKGDLTNQIDTSLLSPFSNQQIPDSSVGDVIIHSEIQSFEPIYYNAELYNADAYLQFVINQSFNKNDSTIFNRAIRYNVLPPSSYKQYSDDLIPINVPIVNLNAMNDSEKTHRLNDGSILDTEMGYVDSLKRVNESLKLIGANKTIPLPSDASSDFKANFKTILGWDLVDGRWILYIAIYDHYYIYTTSIPLTSILDASPISAVWKTVGINDPKSELAPPYLILKIKWYQPTDNSAPSLIIADKLDYAGLVQVYETYGNGNGNGNNGDNGNGNNNHKITICHYPPGNLDNAHTQSIDYNALDTHLENGDTIGECGLYTDNNLGLAFYSYLPSAISGNELSFLFNDGDDDSYRDFTEDKLFLSIPNPSGGLNSGKYVYARVGNINDKHISKLLSVYGGTSTNITGEHMNTYSDTSRESIIVPTSSNSFNYLEVGDSQNFIYYQDSLVKIGELDSPMKVLSGGQSGTMLDSPTATITGVGLFWASYRSSGNLYYYIATNQLEESKDTLPSSFSNLPVMQNIQRLHDTTNNRIYLKNYGLECKTGERTGNDCNIEQTLYSPDISPDSIPLIPFSVGTIYSHTD
ncbi:hypothetical protein [Francisella frigiditurris]|uniref:Uncharacterized protein n=1 Tax=Francisella frigiditurris TaxID=1542390 RepID=A0A1J0KUP6_9GAMM|nr:hypothetical protein [Francisella frigiditurris]APC97509.1 hypothetical protein KX01_232 [Francisella frigiditurris]